MFSLESVQRMATTTYARVVETLSLNDRRKPEGRLDTILSTRPDVIIIAGGTERRSILLGAPLGGGGWSGMFDDPKEQRPHVLYAGNGKLVEEVKTRLKSVNQFVYCPQPEAHPGLRNRLLPAEPASPISSVQCAGVNSTESRNWIPGPVSGLSPRQLRLGGIIQFLSKVYDSSKRLFLGSIVGASATTIAAAFRRRLDPRRLSTIRFRSGIGRPV